MASIRALCSVTLLPWSQRRPSTFNNRCWNSVCQNVFASELILPVPKIPRFLIGMKISTRLSVLFWSVFVVALGPCLSITAEEKKVAPSGFYDLKTPQVAAILKKFPNFVILDIRTPKEFNAGHLKGAKNIDFYDDNFAGKIAKLSKEKSYLVHCASGGRSGRSMSVFKEQGFQTVYHLADGYRGWVAAKQPTVKPKAN